mmetsp:Transcript_17134/g.24261  ORF Transcript_17134/g.24261 Transcript_17134/m.24261 type:complete len:252 (-) Transcript_17134:229-984(-)
MSLIMVIGMGEAFMNKRLCLLADLDRHMRSDSCCTVSQYDTTGWEISMGAPPMKSSWRSFKQISKCSSPAPATTCSPLLVEVIWTRGSDLARRLRPSVSFFRSAGFFTFTAWRTTADTEYFITRMLWAVSDVVMVPVFSRYWSTPTRPQVLPAGMSFTRSTERPIMMMVRWMAFTYRSVFLPGTKLGPMMRHFWPVAILPENTRPKAKKRDWSAVGTILDTYIIRGPSASHFFMATAHSSSMGPSYKISVR